MPTYVISLAKNLVNDAQKSAIAEAISRVQNESTGAPSYFVQVVFEEKEPSNRFLGGSLEEKHVWVRGDIRAGRTEAQRAALILSIMRQVSSKLPFNDLGNSRTLHRPLVEAAQSAARRVAISGEYKCGEIGYGQSGGCHQPRRSHF
jgi:phenylpyruvate tautomerase PptA (4-oxalocrotonate tautomerase family)